MKVNEKECGAERHVYIMTRGKWVDIGLESQVDVQDGLAEGVPWKKE